MGHYSPETESCVRPEGVGSRGPLTAASRASAGAGLCIRAGLGADPRALRPGRPHVRLPLPPEWPRVAGLWGCLRARASPAQCQPRSQQQAGDVRWGSLLRVAPILCGRALSKLYMSLGSCRPTARGLGVGACPGHHLQGASLPAPASGGAGTGLRSGLPSLGVFPSCILGALLPEARPPSGGDCVSKVRGRSPPRAHSRCPSPAGASLSGPAHSRCRGGETGLDAAGGAQRPGPTPLHLAPSPCWQAGPLGRRLGEGAAGSKPRAGRTRPILSRPRSLRGRPRAGAGGGPRREGLTLAARAGNGQAVEEEPDALGTPPPPCHPCPLGDLSPSREAPAPPPAPQAAPLLWPRRGGGHLVPSRRLSRGCLGIEGGTQGGTGAERGLHGSP